MKLAEALQERADVNTRIDQLRERLKNNAQVQEGEKTAEDPAELMRELDGCVARLESLIARINRTNSQTVQDGRTLTQMLARRDALTTQISVYHAFLSDASRIWQRASGSEIKLKSAVDVKALRAKVDGLAKELRTLDNAIQALNWTTELL